MSRWNNLIILVMCTVLAACTDLSPYNDRIDALESRLDKIQSDLTAINRNVAAIEAMYRNTSVINMVDKSRDGKSWMITLSNGDIIKIQTGSFAELKAPVVAVSADGCWTVDYGDGRGPQSIKQSGKNVKVSDWVPVFGVDDEGCWKISNDGGTNWSPVLDSEGNKVKASSAKSGDVFFKDVIYADGKFSVVLRNGNILSLPVVPSFYCRIDCKDEIAGFNWGESKSFPVEMGGVKSYNISSPYGWKAVIDGSKLKVTAPSMPLKSELVYADSESEIAVLCLAASGFVTVSKIKVHITE